MPGEVLEDALQRQEGLHHHLTAGGVAAAQHVGLQDVEVLHLQSDSHSKPEPRNCPPPPALPANPTPHIDQWAQALTICTLEGGVVPTLDGGQTGLPKGYLARNLLPSMGRGEKTEIFHLLHHKFPSSLFPSLLTILISRDLDGTSGILGLAGIQDNFLQDLSWTGGSLNGSITSFRTSPGFCAWTTSLKRTPTLIPRVCHNWTH